MDDLKRRRILELAQTAPNVDNAQPFYFRWDGDRFHIFRDEERDRRRGNAGNVVSMAGLGCLVECIVIAAGGEGFVAGVDVRYELQNPQAPWATVTFAPAKVAPDALLPGLKVRCSDRREYQGGALTDDVFAQVQSDADRFPGSGLYFHEPIDLTLLNYLLRCEEFLWADEHILPEMLSWVRWNRKETQGRRDGVPWQALGVSFVTSRLMRFISRSRRFRLLARRSGGPLRAQQGTLEAHVRSSAALGCLTVADTEPETMVQLGRLFLRTWVRLNMAGYGVQVMANPATHAFQHVAGILPEDYPAASKRIFAGGDRILAQAFGVPDGQIPAWMFRTGQSTPLPAAMRTLRLPLARVLRSPSA